MPRAQQLTEDVNAIWSSFDKAYRDSEAYWDSSSGAPCDSDSPEQPDRRSSWGSGASRKDKDNLTDTLWLQHKVFEPAALNIHAATAQVSELHGIQQLHSHQTKTAGRMLRDTMQHIRGKVLLDCASISGGARTETSTTIMTEGAR